MGVTPFNLQWLGCEFVMQIQSVQFLVEEGGQSDVALQSLTIVSIFGRGLGSKQFLRIGLQIRRKGCLLWLLISTFLIVCLALNLYSWFIALVTNWKTSIIQH